MSRTFVDGFCTVCGAPDPDYTGEPDGLPMAPEQEQLPASAAPTEGPVPQTTAEPTASPAPEPEVSSGGGEITLPPIP